MDVQNSQAIGEDIPFSQSSVHSIGSDDETADSVSAVQLTCDHFEMQASEMMDTVVAIKTIAASWVELLKTTRYVEEMKIEILEWLTKATLHETKMSDLIETRKNNHNLQTTLANLSSEHTTIYCEWLELKNHPLLANTCDDFDEDKGNEGEGESKRPRVD